MTQLITLASLNRPLTCAEFDSNNQALRERANHTGTQLSSTISDFGARVDGLPTIVALQLCCSDLTASIATLRDDIFGSGDLNALLTALEARVVNQINALAAVVGNQQDQITTLTLDISSIIANIQALTTSTSSLQAQITALVGVVATKAPINSPALTGTPEAPTAAPGTNTTQIATTAFVTAAIFPATDTSFGTVRTNTFDAVPIVYRKQEVDNLLLSYAPLTSPLFSGTASIAPGSEPLAAANDNKIPTTAWVRSHVATNVVTPPLASTAAAGIIKSHSNSSNPITYLKDDVDGLLSSKAPVANPSFTGSATIPNATITGTSTIGNVTLQGSADLASTPSLTDNSTKLVNSSWVVQYVTGVTNPPSGSGGEEPETTTLMSRFSGSYSTLRRADINTLIRTLKQAGIYQVLDRLFIFTSPNVTDAMVNWITAYNTSGVFSGPSNTHKVEIGITEGSVTINGFNALANAKPNNLTLLLDNWSRATVGPNNASITGGVGFGYNPSAPNVLINTLQLKSDVFLEDSIGTFNQNSTDSNFVSITDYVAAATIHNSTPFVVSASVKKNATSLYLNGSVVGLTTREVDVLISESPIDIPTNFNFSSVIVSSANRGFSTCAVVGGYLSAQQHSILTSSLHEYIASYIDKQWNDGGFIT